MLLRVDANEVLPLHSLRTESKLAELTRLMRSGGWQGRPVLVVPEGGKYRTWTGSHRVLAAGIAGIKVPIYVPGVGIEEHVKRWERVRGKMLSDEERLVCLHAWGNQIAVLLLDVEVLEKRLRVLCETGVRSV